MKKPLALFLVGLVIVAGGIALVSGFLAPGVPVDVVRLGRQEIVEFVDERGQTRLPQTYLITMPYNGRIEPVTLVEGDPVEKNNPEKPVARVVQDDLELNVQEAQAVVDRLDAAIEENLAGELEGLVKEQALKFVASMGKTVDAARARLTKGRAKLDYSESYLGRIAEASNRNAVAPDELERAMLQKVVDEVDFAQDNLVLAATESLNAATQIFPRMVDQTVADKQLTDAVLRKQRAEAVARLDQARLRKTRGTITSPVDGMVLKRLVSNEQSLAAGTAILEIGRLEDLEVEADMLSVDVVNASRGDRVTIYGPAIGRNLPDEATSPGKTKDYAEGTVDKIYPAGFTKISSLGVEQQRVKVIVRFDPDDLNWLRSERGLGVGYRVRVRITTARKPNALVVPRSALFRGADNTWQVYAVKSGRVRTVSVTVGMMNDELAEIVGAAPPKDMLNEGDQVVRAPEGNLEEGTRVKPVPIEKRPT